MTGGGSFYIRCVIKLGLLASLMGLEACSQHYAIKVMQGAATSLGITRVPTSGRVEAVEAPPAGTAPDGTPRMSSITSFNAGKQPLGSVTRHTIYFQNRGEMPAVVKSYAVKPDELADKFSVISNCNTLMANNQNFCSFNLNFNPDSLGSLSASLLLEYDDGAGQLRQMELPVVGNVNDLATLRFGSDLLDLKTDTVGYSVSGTVNVIYNGAHLKNKDFAIKPAMGVMLLAPTSAEFTVDPVGTTCGAVIQADCVIRVKFTAASAGAKSATLSVSYFNGSENLKTSMQLAGAGLTSIVLATLNSAAKVDFGKVVTNPPTPPTLYPSVNFLGSVPADNVVVTTPATAAFSLKTDPALSTCLTTNKINGPCRLAVTFNPDQRGPFTDQITINYMSNGQARTPIVIALSGTGVNPANITISPALRNFGPVPAFRSDYLVYTLKNTGEAQVSALAPAIHSDSVNFTTVFEASCGSLIANATCSLYVYYRPLSAGAHLTEFHFNYFTGRTLATVTAQASGVGTAPIVLPCPGSSLDFGNVVMGMNPVNIPAASVAFSVYGTTKISTASQISATPSQLGSPFEFPGGSYPGSGGGGTCTAPLDPLSTRSCFFKVGLTTTQTGLTMDVPATAPLTLNYSDDTGGGGSCAFTLRMTPRDPPTLSFTNAPSNFGTIAAGDSASLNFDIKNDSPYFAAGFVSAALSGDSGVFTSVNGCTGGLTAGASCRITVKFQPLAERAYAGTLTFIYNNQLVSTKVITANFSGTGSGNIKLVNLSGPVLDFGTVYLGDTVAARPLTFKYFGLKTWTPGVTVLPPFAIVASACGAAADCILSVSYLPSVPGTSQSTASLAFDNPLVASDSPISFTLRGVAIARSALITFPPLSFGKKLSGTQTDKVTTVTNSGSTAATTLAFTVAGPRFSLQPSDPSMSTPCALGGSLAPAQTCQLKIRYSADQTGPESGTLTVGFRDPGIQSVTAALSGVATVPIRVFAGGYQSCLIDELQKVVCWGSNLFGQLGRGDQMPLTQNPQSLAKVSLGASSTVRELSIGGHHICALLSTPTRTGLVTCWGDNAKGRLGLGSAATLQTRPLLLAGEAVGVNLGLDASGLPLEALHVSAGVEHSCALLTDGRIKCWGGNSSGQLGIGSTSSVGLLPSEMGNSLVAVDLKGQPATRVSAGAGHTCAVLTDGSAKCWGDNFYGQLGQGLDVASLGGSAGELSSLAPIALGTGARAIQIFASNGASTCVLLVGGAIKCFGKAVTNEESLAPYFGNLGSCWARPKYNASAVSCASNPGFAPSNALGYFGTDMGDNLPAVALGATPIERLAVGDHFSCVQTSDKIIRCWGANDRGQLGKGDTLPVGVDAAEMGTALAITLAPGANVSTDGLASGAEHACAVTSGNQVKCWGSATEGATALKLIGVTGDALSAKAAPAVYDGNL